MMARQMCIRFDDMISAFVGFSFTISFLLCLSYLIHIDIVSVPIHIHSLYVVEQLEEIITLIIIVLFFL